MTGLQLTKAEGSILLEVPASPSLHDGIVFGSATLFMVWLVVRAALPPSDWTFAACSGLLLLVLLREFLNRMFDARTLVVSRNTVTLFRSGFHWRRLESIQETRIARVSVVGLAPRLWRAHIDFRVLLLLTDGTARDVAGTQKTRSDADSIAIAIADVLGRSVD